MPVKLSLSPDRHGEWRVMLDGTEVVCFSGPSAREQALQRSRELAALLNVAAEVDDGALPTVESRNPTRA